MSLSVTFRRAARAEFIEAAAWYETQRPGLGVEFIAEIERCVDAAAERPATYEAIDKDIRRVVANRFPFSVYSNGRTTNRRFGGVPRQAQPRHLAAHRPMNCRRPSTPNYRV
jgi:plasmid stabilization system protein ParE